MILSSWSWEQSLSFETYPDSVKSCAFVFETALFESHAEDARTHRTLVVHFAPFRVGEVEVGGFGASIGIQEASVGEESAEDVHVAAIGIGGAGDLGRVGKTFLLPFEAAGGEPVQDSAGLGPEFLGQVFVLSLIWYCDVEGYQGEAPPEGMVGAVDDGQVVTAHEYLMGRLELEVVFMHASSGQSVAAGKLLHCSFGEGFAEFDFGCYGEPASFEIGDGGRMHAAAGGEEDIGWERSRVGAHNMHKGFEEGGFAVSAGTVEEEELLFGDRAGERISAGALGEGDRVGITAEYFLEEVEPETGCGTGGVEIEGRESRDHVFGAMFAQGACSQVDCAIVHVEEPGVVVKGVGLDNDFRLCPELSEGVFDVFCRFRAGDPFVEAEAFVVGSIGEVGAVGLRGCADDPSPDLSGFVGGPVAAVPCEETTEFGAIAGVVSVELDEPAGVIEVIEVVGTGGGCEWGGHGAFGLLLMSGLCSCCHVFSPYQIVQSLRSKVQGLLILGFGLKEEPKREPPMNADVRRQKGATAAVSIQILMFMVQGVGKPSNEVFVNG